MQSQVTRRALRTRSASSLGHDKRASTHTACMLPTRPPWDVALLSFYSELRCRLRIIPGTEWGKATKITRTVLKASSVNIVTVHHDASPAPENATLAYARVRGHQAFHISKWSGGLGYNFLISPFGQIFEGRGFNNRGAHAASVNHRSWGVCFLGSELTPESIAAFLWLHAEMQRRANRKLPVIGHGQLKLENTSCPGKSIRDWVNAGTPGKKKPAPKPAPVFVAPKKKKAGTNLFLIRKKGQAETYITDGLSARRHIGGPKALANYRKAYANQYHEDVPVTELDADDEMFLLPLIVLPK